MKIICIGRNYVEHAKELNNPIPSTPMVFMKPPTSLLINNKPFYYPDFTKDLNFECEVVLKICKNGRHVQPAFALGYIEEITLGIDFTARDLQEECKKKGHPWEIAKAFDHSAVIGDLVEVKELDINEIHFKLLKNGEPVQTGNTRDMIFSFTDIIVYTSKFFKLQVGDYIFTGTPAGVGAVQIGDMLEGVLQTKEGERKVFECSIK